MIINVQRQEILQFQKSFQTLLLYQPKLVENCLSLQPKSQSMKVEHVFCIIKIFSIYSQDLALLYFLETFHLHSFVSREKKN